MDYITLGGAPPNEDCAQVGSDDYYRRALIECKVYLNLIKRVMGEPPDDARLSIKSFPHEYGTYHEVCVSYKDEDWDSTEYAFRCESDGPANWDEQARRELDEALAAKAS